MAARDRYEINLKCGNCGATGTVEVSEDDYPFQRGPGFWIDKMPEGFSVSGESTDKVGTTFHCDTCEEIVRTL